MGRAEQCRGAKLFLGWQENDASRQLVFTSRPCVVGELGRVAVRVGVTRGVTVVKSVLNEHQAISLLPSQLGV